MKDKEIQGMQIRICNACKQHKKCDKELCTMSELVAKELSRFYQPKLPEDSVVLSREEICELKCQAEEDFNKAYDLGSKETAEKFAEKLKDKFKGHGILFYDKAQDCHYYRSIGKEIDELLKEYEK